MDDGEAFRFPLCGSGVARPVQAPNSKPVSKDILAVTPSTPAPAASGAGQRLSDPVRLEGVAFGHAGHPEHLRDIDLILAAASFNFLTGASGAGKTSLIALMAGLARPDRGTVRVFAQDPFLSHGATRRRIGLIAQDDPLLGHMSVIDNLAVTLRLTGERAETRRDDLAAMLDWVGLTTLADLPARSLSKAERRALALARAMMTGPELILADEPLAGLDAAAARRMTGLLRSLCRQGATVLVTMNPADATVVPRVDERVWTLDGGRLAMEPTP